MSYASMHNTMKFGLLVMVCCVTGCASMKSPTQWFSKNDPAGASSPGFTSKFSQSAKGLNGQLKTMGSTISSAYQKTTSAVKNTFGKEKSAFGDDPTSLANMPGNLGPEIWVTNGQVYESQGKFTKALDNYTKAIEKDPKSEVALLSIARLYSRQQQYPEAIEFFNKSLAVNASAMTYNELGSALQGAGQMAEAQAAMRKSIEMDAANPKFRNSLAGLLVSSGRSEEAVSELEQVFPPAAANYNVAYLHLQNQNLAAANQHLQAALQHDPNFTKAQELLSQIGSSGMGQQALATYENAKSIYRTAEAVTGNPINANPAVYQLPGISSAATGMQPGAVPTMTAPSSTPTVPASGFTGMGLPTVQ